ncbi:C40 family peptidase [Lachnoclostridium sp.]|uniref:C40 family peptidase n=1 Tax=Lachnoclostridium sp. TaxID=2028282 RepID=UPI00289AE404|nr:peptidoglycan-binding domain-containing protein [Lachnoclostridium sp.]
MSNYKKLMTDQQLKEKVLDIATNFKTCYLYGGTGQLVTNAIIDQKSKQLPSWYTSSRITVLKKLVGNGYYGFDCVNLIKAILWGWEDGKMGKYASNTVPDTNANGFINLCEDVSTDMTNIKPMELIWFSGHVGLYLGNGECVECAPSLNKVAITKLTYQNKWCKHGKLPWITYTEDVKRKLELTTPYMRGDDVKKLQKLMGVTPDGIYGPATDKKVKEILSAIGM